MRALLAVSLSADGSLLACATPRSLAIYGSAALPADGAAYGPREIFTLGMDEGEIVQAEFSTHAPHRLLLVTSTGMA